MKKFLLGIIVGVLLAGVSVALLFFGVPSERRLSDIHTIGFRMANQDRVLYFAKYLPDGLSPMPFAAVVVLDSNLNLVGSASVPPEMLGGSEIIVEADRGRRNLQIHSPDARVALRWSFEQQGFTVCTNTSTTPFGDAQLILRSVKAK